MIVSLCFVLLLLGIGTYVETAFLDLSKTLANNGSFASIALFFTVVNINVIFLFLFAFLAFRNGVKLVVDRRSGRFGSTLRTKLVTSFLFFSLLPTVILLYISTKFVNANFEKWLPKSLVSTTESSRLSESQYQEKLLNLLNVSELNTDNIKNFDFVYRIKNSEFIYLKSENREIAEKLSKVLQEKDSPDKFKIQWHQLDKNLLYAFKKSESNIVYGMLTPPMIHPQWQKLSQEFSQVKPGVDIIRVSYYVMLGVLTMLIVFSATWLGFTIEREFAVPIQILAAATESVATGDYSVKIDDIVSDDEIGSLARSFRSMVEDLRSTKIAADEATAEMERKADELFEKSEYNAILLADINAAVVTVNRELRIESWNHFASKIFKISEFEAMGRPLSQVINGDIYNSSIRESLIEIENNKLMRLTREFSGTVAGEELQLHLTLSKIAVPHAPSGVVIFINDVTELAKAHRLAAWRDVARRIAHEIKNPLTPIKLGAQRLERRFSQKLESTDAEVFKESIKVILSCTESIKGLVDEFIRFSRMPQAVLQLGNFISPVQLAVASFSENDENVPVFLEIRNFVGEVVNDLPALLWRFDSDQILRMCVNLISNAVAASTQKKHPVLVKLELGENNQWFRLKVLDQGIGVPDKVKARIFEPYFSTKRSGTGLGLLIVEQIASEHGAKVTFEDNLPQGSIFAVEFAGS